MTTPRKLASRDELANIEDALIETILNAGEEELRQEIIEAGGDPDQCIATVHAAIGRARADCARNALESARSELAAWRAKGTGAGGLDRVAARARLVQMRSGDPELASKMMLAARKGDGLSDRDLEGLLDDIADLERLDREDGDA